MQHHHGYTEQQIAPGPKTVATARTHILGRLEARLDTTGWENGEFGVDCGRITKS
jgi:hypothetical protein